MNKNYISLLVLFLLLSTSVAGVSNQKRQETFYVDKSEIPTGNGLMDSSWPMYGHDIRHTGKSDYDTTTNNGGIKWMVRIGGGIDSSPSIGADGTIYVGGIEYGVLYALYPNGTEKWQFRTHDWMSSTPALADDGTIYVGSWDNSFYAVYPNGTMKWQFGTGGWVASSPAIAEDGTIYVGSVQSSTFYAINPDGTEKWHYTAGDYIFTSPAIGQDGTVYSTSNDRHLYAFYPNNGTMKWRYGTGDCGSPTIGDDGTIYIASWNGYLLAVNPDGTEKWKSNIDGGSGKTPSIAQDGTIYIGGEQFYAIYPNGTRKWTYDPGQFYDVTSLTNAISCDGTIYFGISNETGAGGYIIAIDSNGNEKWREWIHDEHVYSSPAIGEDGTIYIGCTWSVNLNFGILYAFNGEKFKDPVIEKPQQGKLYVSDQEKRSTLFGNTICIKPITIEASHPDPINVSKVEFYLDGEKMYETTTQPYQWTYDKISFRKHTITVSVTNKVGVVRTDSITFLKLF